MGNTQFPLRIFVSYRKNQLQFPYHLTRSGIRYCLRVFCPCWPFLYPYIVTSPVFLQLMLFKCTLYCLNSYCTCRPSSPFAFHDIMKRCTWIGYFFVQLELVSLRRSFPTLSTPLTLAYSCLINTANTSINLGTPDLSTAIPAKHL